MRTIREALAILTSSEFWRDFRAYYVSRFNAWVKSVHDWDEENRRRKENRRRAKGDDE